MNNRDTSVAWDYHDATKHSLRSVRSSGHGLDWDNYPLLFKVYPNLEAIPLPQLSQPLPCDVFTAISSSIPPTSDRPPLDLTALARLFFLSAGVTRRRTHAGGEIYFRAAANTGAMYAIELYLVCEELPGLEAGVYHFGPGDFALRQLRKGDFRNVVVRAAAAEPAVENAPAIIVSTGTYWRNAWKYQARTYRHFGWDNGTLLANLLAAATGLGLSARVVLGFQDDPVNQLLAVDTRKEVALSLVAIGSRATPAAEVRGELSPVNAETVPYSKQEVDYPVMREMHAASSLESDTEVREWRGPTPRVRTPVPAGKPIPIASPARDAEGADSIDRVILRRGSTRSFAQQSIALPQLRTILGRATQGVSADFIDPPTAMLNDLYLIVNAVDGMEPGAYVFDVERQELQCLKEGNFRGEAGHLALDQELGAAASVAVFFLADLNPLLEHYGNRGYRAVQLEAGIVGGRMYLAAYAQHLGATGLTFYDDEVTEFFSPHAADKSAIFLVAIGKSARR
ncbi:MAG: SagB/ThcOx family dehydrogenase [SAR324 cluster bacterium]|nr:SagB/ThcOx family dehydrogenase [SAR324 cluster bacterium]